MRPIYDENKASYDETYDFEFTLEQGKYIDRLELKIRELEDEISSMHQDNAGASI